ncbi:hypothetical protein ACSBR1_042127 [Camellia fascicularis]
MLRNENVHPLATRKSWLIFMGKIGQLMKMLLYCLLKVEHVQRLSNDGERDVDILKTTLQVIALAIREGNAFMEKSQGYFPRGELHKALEETGIAPHLFTEAYLFLTKKFERMMQFFGFLVEYRKETLESMMYNPENRW